MNMALYCKSQGMNLSQYETFKQNIINTASAIIQCIKETYKTDTGIYYPINEILSFQSNDNMKQFIIQELKNQGVEFYDNNSLWRY
jgi:hypothetical protein